MNRDKPAPNEWYHVYNRGVDKRKTFMDYKDYERMQELLYITNATKPIHRSDKLFSNKSELFSLDRGSPLVDVAAYCLMPNHVHLLLRSTLDNGISSFMRKLMTGYTMYFNIKYERTGNLFYKPFRSRHVPDDRYGQHVFNYILSNPWELSKSGPKLKQIQFIETYKYGSLADLLCPRIESAILTPAHTLPFSRKPTAILFEDAHFFDT